MLIPALVVLGLAGALAAYRTRRVAVLTRRTLERRTLGADGIVIGGETMLLPRPGAPAVLLLHGAGDTPQTLRYLAQYLYDRGFHVIAPLLPGHGRRVSDFARVTADDLTNAARAAYVALRSEHEWTGIIGLSMGGALAVQVAAEFPDLPALGLASPYLAMPRKIEVAARWSRIWGVFVPVLDSTEGKSVLDPEEQDQNLAYGVFTPGALRALANTVRRAQAAAPFVQAPTLVVQSRQDNRISVVGAEEGFARIGAREKRLEWITGASHVITVDFGREHVFELLGGWLEQHGAGVSAGL